MATAAVGVCESVSMHVCMYICRWMDGWMDGWMDEWMDVEPQRVVLAWARHPEPKLPKKRKEMKNKN